MHTYEGVIKPSIHTASEFARQMTQKFNHVYWNFDAEELNSNRKPINRKHAMSRAGPRRVLHSDLARHCRPGQAGPLQQAKQARQASQGLKQKQLVRACLGACMKQCTRCLIRNDE
ncbi:30S ribosomal protein S4 [Frankliniella fusca]|uniref:30S ribosomal protein S4 n=1 Tax=Frankliniella fusca TaxID=407009 RepID=A0AAE1HRR0_9NEOP|nr:30S ribosomal protein S4 [Frankliniella fusca]